MQAAPIEGFATERRRHRPTSSMAAGASVVVIADRVGGGEWQGEDALLLLKRLTPDRAERDRRVRRRAPARAGRARRPRAAHRARAAVRLGAGSARRRRARARRAGASTARRATWRCQCSACRRITRDPVGRRDGRRLRADPRSSTSRRGGGSRPASPRCGRQAVRARRRRGEGRRVHVRAARAGWSSCFVAPDDRGRRGTRTRTGALPVRLGPGGIVEVVMPSLSAAERVALDNAMQL